MRQLLLLFENSPLPTLHRWCMESGLRITEPKELAQFDGLRETKFGFEPRQLERPPQSWCYVEG